MFYITYTNTSITIVSPGDISRTYLLSNLISTISSAKLVLKYNTNIVLNQGIDSITTTLGTTLQEIVNEINNLKDINSLVVTAVTSVSATSPITSSGGLTPNISTSMATNRLIGRGTAAVGVMEEITLGTGLSLTATTLNATGVGTPLTNGHILVGSGANLATDVAMSSEATIINTGAVTLTNSAVIAKVLTGYVSGAGVVAATDTILQAIEKLNGNNISLNQNYTNSFLLGGM